jgi:hypothetical protein
LGAWILLSATSLAACGHTGAPSASGSVLVVPARPPNCRKIGVVEGVGGRDETAIDSALAKASERGATHAVLGTPDLNVTDGMTTVVDAALFDCLPAPAEYPPVGYPQSSGSP